MVDYISAKNYKILSDKELIEWQNETKNKIKELQNRLLNINRAIKNRKFIDMENKQIKCVKRESCLHCGSNYCRFVDELDQLKAKNEELIRRITKIFACLIKANRTNKIVDTLWVDNITTLWDYIAQTLGIEGDQVQIEEQILQKISECEVKNDNK